MKNEKLHLLLEQLHQELDEIENMDEKDLEMLKTLETNISGVLSKTDKGQPVDHPNIIQQVERSIDYFEFTHPTLSATLVKLLTVLGNAGI